MNQNYNVFDIETEAFPESEVAHLMPEFKAPSNYSDPSKIAAYKYGQKAEWLERLALSPTTGRVLVIGVWQQATGQTEIFEGDEKDILNRFWNMVGLGGGWVGFNSNSFDLPFAIKRSLRLGVKPAVNLFKSRYSSKLDQFEDIREYWQCGDKTCSGSLDVVSKFFGLKGKNGSGKDFAKLYRTDKPKAIAYAVNDIELTRDLGLRIGVIPDCKPALTLDDEYKLGQTISFSYPERDAFWLGTITKVGSNSITITREDETYIKDLLDGTVTKI